MDLSLVSLLGLLSISIGTLYVTNSSNRTAKTVQEARRLDARARMQTLAISDLAILRSLMSSTRIDPSTYQPAIFPLDYFSTTWDLTKNDLVPTERVSTSAMKVTIPSNGSDIISQAHLVSLFTKESDFTNARDQLQLLKITRLNRSVTHPLYVESVDVEVTRTGSVGVGAEKASFSSVGRIKLEPPILKKGLVLIKKFGDSEYSENFGTPGSPLQPGKYSFLVKASGVVPYADVSIGNVVQRIGITVGKITSLARNVRAREMTVGETALFDLGGSPSSSAGRPSDRCSFIPSVSPVTESVATSTLKVSVHLVGVKGEQTSLDFAKNLYLEAAPAPVGRAVPYAYDSNGQAVFACQNKCPVNYRDLIDSDSKFELALETAVQHPADKKLVDYFHGIKTEGLYAGGIAGSICANYELVADAMVDTSGIPIAASWASNRDEFNFLKNASMGLERFYAYRAPSCDREFVGQRDDCGCFAENTQILFADGSIKPASAVRSGDWLWNPRLNQAQQVARVVAGPEQLPLVTVTAGGNEVVVTGEHPFLTSRGLVKAIDLKLGEILVSGEQKVLVERIDFEKISIGQKAPIVWNFELVGTENEDEHYVSANGVMTGDLYLQKRLQNGREPSSEGASK
ncbi:MAG: hypothetical protein EOP04_00195 [Proteobacteria bacterium]|nr:MAG: hypothetical protein EOP04_00195 [Pseudomonadota bacterium]